MEDKGESKFRNVMERYWYALFIIARIGRRRNRFYL